MLIKKVAQPQSHNRLNLRFNQSAILAQRKDGSRIEIITFDRQTRLIILAPPGVYREMVETSKD